MKREVEWKNLIYKSVYTVGVELSWGLFLGDVTNLMKSFELKDNLF